MEENARNIILSTPEEYRAMLDRLGLFTRVNAADGFDVFHLTDSNTRQFKVVREPNKWWGIRDMNWEPLFVSARVSKATETFIANFLLR